MALLTSIPGTTSTNDGFLSIDSIKQAAKRTSSALQGATSINLIGTGRKAADAGIMKEDAGDLQEALLKYYTVANILNVVLSSPEYKAESASDKHGAVYREAKTFAEYVSSNIFLRLKLVEKRLQEIESTRSLSVAGPSSVNGNTEAGAESNREDADESGPNQRSGGSLADRMRMLAGAGLDTSLNKPVGPAGKRYSHRPAASTSTVASSTLQTPNSPLGRSAPSDVLSSTAPVTFSETRLAQPTPSTPVPSTSQSTASSRRHTMNSFSQSQTASYSPSLATLYSLTPTPSTPASTSEFDPVSITLEEPGSSPSSPHAASYEVYKHATGGSAGMPSSPRHRNLQTLAGPSSPRFNGTGTPSPKTSSPLARNSDIPPATELPTPSISQFNSAFPTIEDLDSTYALPTLPSAPQTELPSFPSVPSTKPGTKTVGPGPAPSSENMDLWKSMPSSPTFPSSSSGGPRYESQSSVAGPSIQSQLSEDAPHVHDSPAIAAGLPIQNSGGSYMESRMQTSGGRSSPTKRPAPPLPVKRNTSPTKPTPRRKPDIPIGSSIFPKALAHYLDHSSNGGLDLLLLDVRPRAEFEKEHIACEAEVCLDPTILMRAGINASGIESALVISPGNEEKLFQNRDKFDMVVIYDASSTSFSPPHLAALNKAIYELEFYKKLSRPPILLVGGLAAWKKELGVTGLVGKDVQGEASKSTRRTSNAPAMTHEGPRPDTQKGALNGHPISYNASIPIPRNTGLDNYSLDGTNGMDPAEKERRRRAHVRDGAVFEPPSVNDENVPPDARGRPVDRLNRRSALVRPSSSGNISAYNRPIPEMADGGVYAGYPTGTMSPASTNGIMSPSASLASLPQSILAPTQSSSVALPPQASLSKSPLARRRSDYVEQALYPYSGSPSGNTRAPIDYPALSSVNMLKYPPPVATNALERQEARHRSPLSPLNSQPDPSSHQVTMINGKPFLMPPTINTARYHVIYWDEVQIGMSGLKNLGNTCYMNSIVQCLSATVPFARFFIDGRWKSAINMQNPLGTQGSVAFAFATIVHELWQRESPYLTPYAFRNKICAYAPQFGGSDQHDAQEFLSFLVDGLHEDLNRIIKKPALPSPTPERERELETLPTQLASAQEWQIYRMRDDSIVVDYFQGQFRNVLRCLTCHKTSTTYNSFMYLSLPIPSHRGLSKPTLYSCVDAFVKPEIMEKSEAWNCPHCKVLRKATKQLSLARLPPVLLIVLKRFSFKGPFTDKVDTMIDFPLKGLDLTNYLPALLPSNISKVEGYGQEEIDPATDPRAQVPPYKYDLYGVTNHFGNLSSGHYTSFIASKGGWVYCDDSRLANANPKDVVGKPAYILFYKRVRP
ncbi:ubiquitin-specific protease doa4 [Tulasnella sp. JGI-2019a]|nr:ubiquitin-specific protease doa4 [Tulasnella sp. JGI-2019a]KAG9030311.1 ubiquitin-specific protease doa4 [Tulasnella sp. JGI-2019a]